jgi:hypothetical protein
LSGYGRVVEDKLAGFEPHVFPFGDADYVVFQHDAGPVAVVKPGQTSTTQGCHFRAAGEKAIIVEDHAPAMCRRLAEGPILETVPKQTLPAGAVPNDDEHKYFADIVTFEGFADVSLSQGTTPVRFGYFTTAPHGDSTGIAFLNGNSIEDSPRNRAPIRAEGELRGMGSRAEVVVSDGHTLIELDGWAASKKSKHPKPHVACRALLQIDGDILETLCRVELFPRMAPAP